MTQPYRTASGGRIDRSRLVTFTFDGKRFEGASGDTLASALIANGIHLVARSFKYHRPRGFLSAGSEEPNALVTIARGGGRSTPNVRATQVELYEGLVAESQNRWPSLTFDAGAINDRLGGLFPAGFYYKTFLRPAAFWAKVYEPMIRRAAGLGRAPMEPDPDHYQHRYAHCDVLVVGAGPAGLAAALAASEVGARVIVCDEQMEPGGALLSENVAEIDGKPAAVWLAEAVNLLAARPSVRLLARTTAFGLFAGNMAGLVERVGDHVSAPHPDLPRERLWQVRANTIVLATGAIERPLVFSGNDRPGVMLADAAASYVARWGASPGSRAVIVTACDSAYAAARTLKDAGVAVPLIADIRDAPGASASALAQHIETIAGVRIREVRGTQRVSGIEFSENGRVFAVACDTVLMSGGWTPTVHLYSQARGRLRYDETRAAYFPDGKIASIWTAGSCNGALSLNGALMQGHQAGAAAVAHIGSRAAQPRHYRVTHETPMTGTAIGAAAADPAYKRGKAFVDFQNDVTAKDVALAVREGFHSIEHIKRYTTTGMATDQGKTSNLNTLGIASDALGTSIPEIGHTTFRMPYTPVTFGALAGTARAELFDPVRLTPTNDWAQRHGAVFEDVGQWKRARYFPRGGETMRDAVTRECATVRSTAGIMDASTLGKIEIVGPDAAEFIARMYTGHWPGLKPGGCRYGLMLRDDGFIYDDGVVARLASDRYHITTTTGGAARVLNHMEDYLQTEWPDLAVWLTSVTEQWAVVAVQGPKARDVLAPLVEGVDISREAMPHMSAREGTFRGIPMRLFRVSFTGELGFEVNVPAEYGAAWEAIAERVESVGGCCYGTEAMHVLRAEKGYIIVGQETDGTVTPDDVGLGAMVGARKPDFVGKRGLVRPDLAEPHRKQLVGLLTEDPAVVLQEGAQVTLVAAPATGSRAAGHVTSGYWSAALGRSIALALVERGRAMKGERVYVPMPSASHAATVVEPVFYDPQGARLDG